MSTPDKTEIRPLERFTGSWVKWASSPVAQEVVLSFFAVWLLVGPFMKFSAGWQTIMETASAAITLVMVFLLVRTQTKDTLVIQMKLNEVIAALQGANNQLINTENLGEAAVQELSKRYEVVANKLQEEEAVSTESLALHEIVAEQEAEKQQAENEKAAEDAV